MRVAVDGNDNRVYADIVDRAVECFCSSCGEKVRLRRGNKNIAHFAHLPQTECRYGIDKDNKSEWHIRMQDYFPREQQEVRFIDEQTGEVHIADVFLEDSNTVLEFQHSPISEEEFLARTMFHLNSDRRIAWLFDESSNSKGNTMGRFKHEGVNPEYEYSNYRWMRNPRRFLSKIWKLDEVFHHYSICVYTGTEGDVFRRIVDGYVDFDTVVFSAKKVNMLDFDVDQLFEYDSYWSYKKKQREMAFYAHQREHQLKYQQKYTIKVRSRRKFRF